MATSQTETSQELLSDQQKLEKLVYEVGRAALVWNIFAGTIIDGWYPHSQLGKSGAQITASDRERLDQLFKIRDVETRRLLDVLRELGFEHNLDNWGEIFRELSEKLQITESGHRSLGGEWITGRPS